MPKQSRRPSIPVSASRTPIQAANAARTPVQAAVSLPDDGPLIDLEEDAYDPEAVEKIHVFTLGGVKYMAPETVPASLAVEMLRRTSEDGAEETMWWVFNEVLGADAVEALGSYKGLSMTHLGKLFTICESIITGSFADPKSARPGAALPR
jgi:hypothetical protein